MPPSDPEPDFRPAFEAEPEPPEAAAAAPADPAGHAADAPPLDRVLRPRRLREFIGQERVVRSLSYALEAAAAREEPLEHVLLSGLPGLGKTTLAEIVARELGTNLRATAGPMIDRPGDLAGLLTGLGRGDVLFIDEIHRLSPQVEEYLYGAMDEFRLTIVLDQGPRARSVPITLEPFTLIGATTREGLLTGPFRDRFGIHERVEPYEREALEHIIRRSAALLEVELSGEAVGELARSSRGTPRIANRYLRRVRDSAQVEGLASVEEPTVRSTLERLGVDGDGLSLMDRRVLTALARATPHPVGLRALAVAIGEEERTVEEVSEPWLVRQGLITRTPRGRMLTLEGEAHARRMLSGGAPESGSR